MYTVSQKTVQICFCQHFVKFPPILIIFYRKMAQKLRLCEMHSFSTSPNLRRHTTVLNADVVTLLHNCYNCYTTLKVVICSKLSNDLNSTSKVKCGLFTKIISLYNSSVQNCIRICARSGPHVHGCKRLNDDATENVKPHLQLHVFFGVVTFAASQLYVRVERVKMRYFQGRIFNPTNLLNKSRGALCRVDDANVSNLILIITALCNNLEHLCITH